MKAKGWITLFEGQHITFSHQKKRIGVADPLF
jgi:hypothetical protein